MSAVAQNLMWVVKYTVCKKLQEGRCDRLINMDVVYHASKVQHHHHHHTDVASEGSNPY